MGKWKQVKKRIDRCWQHRYIPYIKENILELQLTPCYNCPGLPYTACEVESTTICICFACHRGRVKPGPLICVELLSFETDTVSEFLNFVTKTRPESLALRFTTTIENIGFEEKKQEN